MNLQEVFTGRLRETRKAKNLTQEKLRLAIRLDEFVVSTYINCHEKRDHQPDLSTLQKIAEILEAPPAPLFSDDEFSAKISDLYRSN